MMGAGHAAEAHSNSERPSATHELADGAEVPNESTEQYLKTELLERVAHELRGPAGVMLGALDELERALASESPEQARVLLSMVRRGARRVLRTAERLTRTAQLESGDLQLAKVSVDLRDLVARAARDAEQIEGRNAIQVELALPAQACHVQVDANWIGVALNELFAQAIRNARRKVQIHVTAERTWTQISVTDDRPAFFEVSSERFIQVRDRRDSALGWPLVSDVARAHGGELSLEGLHNAANTPENGARALLRLRTG